MGGEGSAQQTTDHRQGTDRGVGPRPGARVRSVLARARWLHDAMTGLEPKLREAAVLVVGEELSHAEAASVLGCAESTVSWRMHEVRKKLKLLMEADR